MLSSSNLALVRVSEKSSPSKKDSISILTWWLEERARFAFSTSRRNFWTARLSLRMSLPFFFLYNLMKWSMTRWSKSSPPKWVSPLVATTCWQKEKICIRYSYLYGTYVTHLTSLNIYNFFYFKLYKCILLVQFYHNGFAISERHEF